MAQLTWNRSLIPESLQFRPMAPPPQMPEQSLGACASTASLFLYAQGSVILCLHHDTLAIERQFEHHQEDVSFISVDNVSERGQGRLVVSYDVGQTAIVWDLFTGTEIARFTSFEPLRVAAWMRNGNVAFGNGTGEVILFEPSTSEHISSRTIPDPITTLATHADCRTYAIGYQNGSILIATLRPTFTVLHTLTTSRGPSPLLGLAWHASSSKQKSDMLASQALNGDLRVWSVSKPPEKEQPRTIRVLKRSDATPWGPQWMAWSKNGKIVQYMNGETWAWDVRTKNITSERIETIENLRGISNYGPTATLFTLGPHCTVQQYDLEHPAMVANVQHPPTTSKDKEEVLSLRALQDSPEIKEPGYMFDGRRTPEENGLEAARQRAELGSPVSSGRYQGMPFSPQSKSDKSGSSSFSSLASSSERNTPQPYAYSPSASTPSVKSSRAGSRLKNEVQFSPADKQVDLFPFIRVRLNDIPYGNHQPLDETNLTPDALRQRMLSMVFGWEGNVQELIQDEFNRHPSDSQSAILLAQWLGRSDADDMASIISSGPASMSDWMLLALSQMNGQAQANKVGQAFVRKLLELGDIHTAATILLGLGDSNDAIEVYVSQHHYMEAVLMTCFLMPTDWQRQSYLVRRWGEHVVSHSQQQLAIRCFMCTGMEPSEPWASPEAQNASFAESVSLKSPLKSPEPPYPSPTSIAPSSSHRRKSSASHRATTETPSLKLITSFGPQSDSKFRLPGLKSDDHTPTNAPWITPIAESAVGGGESALSPGGLGSYRMNNLQSLNQAMGSRSVTPGFRGRLPSIGETPIDVHPPTFPSTPFRRAGEYAMTSDSEDQQDQKSEQQEEEPLSLLPSARYEPEKEASKPSPQTAIQAGPDKFAGIKGLPSPAPGVFEALRDHSESRNGSRDRKPDGLQLHLLQRKPSQLEFSDQLDRTSNARSPYSTSSSLHSARTPSTAGRGIDQFIQSLDEANYYSRKHREQRANGHVRRNTDDAVSQNTQEARGRDDDRFVQPPLRSPSSPAPMLSEEPAQYSRRPRHGGSRTRNRSKVRKASASSSRNSSRRKNRSSSRNASSHASEQNDRGRSADSDRSPLMSPADDALRLVTSDRERLRSHQRSNSRQGEERPSDSRDQSADSSGMSPRSNGHHTRDQSSTTDQESAASNSNDASQEEILLPSKAFELPDASMEQTRELPFAIGLSEQKRKELAAAELEARRLSLARNPSAPNIPFPGEARPSARSPPVGFPSFSMSPFKQARQRAPPSKEFQEHRSSSDSGSSGQAGQPGTPWGMRQRKYGHEEQPTPNSADNNNFFLSDARYQPDAERIGRSMSVPVPESQPVTVPIDLPTHPRFNPNLPRSRSTSRTRNLDHRRESSRELHGPGGYYGGSPVAVSIEETLENAMQRRPSDNPPILPELQHLNTPPPPPPPPFSPACTSPRESSGTIDIVIDNENLGRLLPRAMTADPPVSTIDPSRISPEHRRMSFDHRLGKSANESFSSKIRNLTRMRSNSRGGMENNWSSPVEMEMPYESVQMVDNRI